MATLVLYDPKTGEVPGASGLNWCFADAHVCKNDAYFALRKSFFREHPDFFPPQGSVFTGIWDDGTQMKFLLEGTQDIDDEIAPKQISTDGDKSILGAYMRDRLGVPSGHFITRADLDRYGRDSVEVTKIDEYTFAFDFSV